MKTAKVFCNGGSQAIRLPKEFRFNSSEVIIKQCNDGSVLLSPIENRFGDALQKILARFDDDFQIERAEQRTQLREELI